MTLAPHTRRWDPAEMPSDAGQPSVAVRCRQQDIDDAGRGQREPVEICRGSMREHPMRVAVAVPVAAQGEGDRCQPHGQVGYRGSRTDDAGLFDDPLAGSQPLAQNPEPACIGELRPAQQPLLLRRLLQERVVHPGSVAGLRPA